MARKAPKKSSSPSKVTKKVKVGVPTAPLTRITVRCDVGFENNVYIRGVGAGLSWEKGVPLVNEGPDRWEWVFDQAFESCNFKVLVNDEHYESGFDRELECGDHVEYSPCFE